MGRTAFLLPVSGVLGPNSAPVSGAARLCPPSLRSCSTAPARRPTPRASAALQAGAAHTREGGSAAVRSLPSAAALADLLRGSCAPAAAFVVVKLFARSCRACLGASPRYAKSARAFREAVGPETVTFAEMDYSENVEFCQDQLGVEALPFFAIFRRGNDDQPELVEGHNLAWNRLSVLDQRVEEILSEKSLLPPDHDPVRALRPGLPFLSSTPASVVP
jgi:hypothetical protein